MLPNWSLETDGYFYGRPSVINSSFHKLGPEHAQFALSRMARDCHVPGECTPSRRRFGLAMLARGVAAGLAVLAFASWGSTPPRIGPEVKHFAVHREAPDVVFAATRFGVFRSTDGGASWNAATRPGSPLHTALVWSVLFPSSNPREVLAVAEEGIFRSADGGTTWRGLVPPVHAVVDHSSFEKATRALAVHPTNPAIMLLGTGNGIFHSTNAGASWKHVHVRESINVGGIAFDPVAPNRAYAGSDRLLTSADGGLTWTGASSHSLASLQRAWLGNFVTRRAPAPAIFVNASGITLASTDWGQTWKQVPQSCGTLAVSQSGDGVLLTSCGYPYLGVRQPGSSMAGVSKSHDEGLTWTPVNEGLRRDWHASAIAIHPSRPNTYLAGWANGGVYRTADGGASWTNVSKGLTWCELGAAGAVAPELLFEARCLGPR